MAGPAPLVKSEESVDFSLGSALSSSAPADAPKPAAAPSSFAQQPMKVELSVSEARAIPYRRSVAIYLAILHFFAGFGVAYWLLGSVGLALAVAFGAFVATLLLGALLRRLFG